MTCISGVPDSERSILSTYERTVNYGDNPMMRKQHGSSWAMQRIFARKRGVGKIICQTTMARKWHIVECREEV